MRGFHYPDGLSEQQEAELKKHVDEAMGISPELDAVLGPKFTLLRVDTSRGALIYEGEGSYVAEVKGTPLLSLISDMPINGDYVKSLVERTIKPELVTSASVALGALNSIFEKYAFAQPVE